MILFTRFQKLGSRLIRISLHWLLSFLTEKIVGNITRAEALTLSGHFIASAPQPLMSVPCVWAIILRIILLRIIWTIFLQALGSIIILLSGSGMKKITPHGIFFIKHESISKPKRMLSLCLNYYKKPGAKFTSHRAAIGSGGMEMIIPAHRMHSLMNSFAGI